MADENTRAGRHRAELRPTARARRSPCRRSTSKTCPSSPPRARSCRRSQTGSQDLAEPQHQLERRRQDPRRSGPVGHARGEEWRRCRLPRRGRAARVAGAWLRRRGRDPPHPSFPYAPNLLFPYIRQTVSDVVMKGSFRRSCCRTSTSTRCSRRCPSRSRRRASRASPRPNRRTEPADMRPIVVLGAAPGARRSRSNSPAAADQTGMWGHRGDEPEELAASAERAVPAHLGNSLPPDGPADLATLVRPGRPRRGCACPAERPPSGDRRAQDPDRPKSPSPGRARASSTPTASSCTRSPRKCSDAPWPVAVLSGPTFASEVGRACPRRSRSPRRTTTSRRRWPRASRRLFRAYTSDDIVGVEIGGALKNVLAIAAGVSDGLGFGANARAALITRGLAEMTRLGVALGADPLDPSGPGRPRRPRAHLHRRPVAQPPLRPGARGRLPLDPASSRARARRGRLQHRAGRASRRAERRRHADLQLRLRRAARRRAARAGREVHAFAQGHAGELTTVYNNSPLEFAMEGEFSLVSTPELMRSPRSRGI